MFLEQFATRSSYVLAPKCKFTQPEPEVARSAAASVRRQEVRTSNTERTVPSVCRTLERSPSEVAPQLLRNSREKFEVNRAKCRAPETVQEFGSCRRSANVLAPKCSRTAISFLRSGIEFWFCPISNFVLGCGINVVRSIGFEHCSRTVHELFGRTYSTRHVRFERVGVSATFRFDRISIAALF